MELNSELDRLKKYQAIERELQSAKKKHPNYPENLYKQVCIISEESGEIAKAVLQYEDENGSLEEIKKEIIQTAAMCMRMLDFLNN